MVMPLVVDTPNDIEIACKPETNRWDESEGKGHRLHENAMPEGDEWLFPRVIP